MLVSPDGRGRLRGPTGIASRTRGPGETRPLGQGASDQPKAEEGRTCALTPSDTCPHLRPRMLRQNDMWDLSASVIT